MGSDVVPADCLSIQEIGTVAGVFMVLAWVCLLITGMFMAFKAAQVDSRNKPFYYINAFICAVAVYSYFGMFSGMGWQTIMGCRQFFYIRYCDWAVTTALTIMSLGLLAGQDFATIAAVVGADVGMIIAGYLGAVALVGVVKWLWFIVGIALFIGVLIGIVREFRQTVLDTNDSERIELYSRVSLLVLISWTCYPVVWLFSEGAGVFGVSVEVIFYSILDCVAKVWFSFAIVNRGDSSGGGGSDREDDYERQYV